MPPSPLGPGDRALLQPRTTASVDQGLIRWSDIVLTVTTVPFRRATNRLHMNPEHPSHLNLWVVPAE